MSYQKKLFPSAREDVEAAGAPRPSPQTLSPTYRLAFSDPAFLLRDELRPVRLQLELLKPELTFQEKGIEATIVVFGSARILAPEAARKALEEAEKRLGDVSGDGTAGLDVEMARRRLEQSRYYDEARRFARIASKKGHRTADGRFYVMTGGGPGIMEAANRGAHEAGAESIGLNIMIPHEQAPNPYITPELCFQFHYFAIRKMHFLMRAVALVAFPGGFGTFDEVFETLTLIQTGKITRIPVILFGREFWEKAVDFAFLVREGMISSQDLDLFEYAETAEEACEKITRFYWG
ncbi:MAG: TIGR00730 family Rossman fold protein [Deltaproteobacteria bacterium]